VSANEREAPDGDFVSQTEPYRRELLAHCYRMLGSIHDAEDLVQETYLRAWRGYDRFEGRASLRTWLYRIATRACFTALANRERRVLPSGLGAASNDPGLPRGVRLDTVQWLQPVPDALLADHPSDPATIVDLREGTRLAFVAALQHLPARQRAALLLQDVLGAPAGEVAGALGTSPAATNSALQRARAALAKLAPSSDEVGYDGTVEAQTLDRYLAAFARRDIGALTDLLRADVELEMPPNPEWFCGRENVAAFFDRRALRSHVHHVAAGRANGYPAAATYLQQADGSYRAHGIQVIEIRGDRIARINAFLEPSLFPIFGLAPDYPPSPRR
jgi:RNA polymerase sigma-70 factor (ECF subfamily)